MKYVHVATTKFPHGVYGLVEDGEIRLLKGSLLDAPELTGDAILEKDVTGYLPPLVPPNIMCLGKNYREHAAETADELPKAPLLFVKLVSALNHHEGKVIIPSAAPNQVDYEGEMVVIIGRKAKNVSREKALDYVFGYTCGNDVSARDAQRSDGQWARAKSFDTFAPMGPYVVTGVDPSTFRVRTRVNGQTVQDQPTKDLVFDVPYLVSYLSHSITLLPGTAIYTGTPAGVGIARKPPLLLKPGDVVEVDIEGIGILRNHVVAEG